MAAWRAITNVLVKYIIPLSRGRDRGWGRWRRSGHRSTSPAPTYVEATWPEAEFIVGNPPFLGGKRLRRELGDDYVDTLFRIYDKRVPREADLVTYWFEKARASIAAGKTVSAGLVSTNSIRGGANRKVLERVVEDAPIFDAWSDEPWVQDGAAVRVSLVCFGHSASQPRLDGASVLNVSPNLREQAKAAEVQPVRLRENSRKSFQGPVLVGDFDIPGQLARGWLTEPLNVSARPNADVLHPLTNGRDLNALSREYWVISFGDMSEAEAARYEAPFEFAKRHIKPYRADNNRQRRRELWWRHGDVAPAMWSAIRSGSRYIAGSQVSKHRVWRWLHPIVWPHQTVVVIARDDDTTFGILHSRFHEHWSLRLGTSLEDRPRYTPTTTFETFPFPEGLTPNIPAADYAADPRAIRIAEAAKALDDARRAWLNPPDLVDIVPEIVPTAAPGEAPVRYPDRILPKTEEAAEKLKQRTLTKLYNARPQWLADLHDTLDRAVAAAYGWPEDISTEDALARLLALNLERAAAGR